MRNLDERKLVRDLISKFRIENKLSIRVEWEFDRNERLLKLDPETATLKDIEEAGFSPDIMGLDCFACGEIGINLIRFNVGGLGDERFCDRCLTKLTDQLM